MISTCTSELLPEELMDLDRIGRTVLDEFIEYFSRANALELAQKLHYPHVRIAGDKIQLWQTPEEYARDSGHEALKDSVQWGYSAWGLRHLIQASADKLHYAVEFSRFTKEHKRIVTYESFYIITRHGDHWGIQSRSSYAGVASNNTAY